MYGVLVLQGGNMQDKKLGRGIWIMLLFVIIIVTFYWLRLAFLFNLMLYWIMGLILSFALVFILNKILKFWKIPLVIIGLALIFYFQYPYVGEMVIALYLVEIPFIILTILFTIWIYIYRIIKNGTGEAD